MNWPRLRWRYLTDLFRRSQVQHDLDDELKAHLALEIQQRIDRGETPSEARTGALREIRSIQLVREETQDVWNWRLISEFCRDVRLGFRALRCDRIFAISVITILSVGIAATVTMFSVLNAVVLRPLPYARAAELVRISTHLIQENQWDGSSLANFSDWRAQSRTFSAMTYYRRTSVSAVNFMGVDAPQRAQEGLVGPEFFSVLGVEPVIGRAFSRDEFDRKQAVVVLSEGLWQERFARSPNAVGQTLEIDGTPHVVTGVMPAGFHMPTSDTRFWRPASILPVWRMTVRDSDGFEVLGRLAPGVSLEEARTEMAVIAARLRNAYTVNRNLDIRIASLFDFVIGPQTRRNVWLAFAAVLSLLIIACANVGGLLLARTARRRRELAVRTALGAARNRLIRQLIAESVSLWALASAVGVGFAYWAIRLLLVYGPRTLPRLAEAGLDLTSIALSFAVGLAVVLACGTVPAILATKDRASEQHYRLQDLLVSAQIAGTLVLFVGAVLFAQSFLRAQSKEPGYPAENMLIVRIDLPRPTYPDRAALERFFSNVRERVGSLPGVVDVGGITDFFIRRNAGQWVTIKDHMIQKDSNSRLAIEGVTPHYFQAMGIDIVEGRDFEPRDYEPGAPAVFIVSETLARRFWPGESAIGKSLVSGEAPPQDGKWASVVGVVRDIRREALDVEPIMLGFLPSFLRGMDMTIRVSKTAGNVIPAVRHEIHAVDSGLPVMSVMPASSRLADRLGERRFQTQVFGIFAFTALLLSAAGIYGLLAYQVTLRSREIGIRSALGAHRRSIVKMIVGKGLRLAIFGTIAGLLVAAGTATIVQSLLYETSASDVTTYIAAAAFILLIALIASWLPANRAARMDPLSVLRT